MIEHDRPDSTGQDFTLTTKQVAEHFGLSQESIRKIKSANPDRLLEGEHWVNFEGRTCWDESAISVIEAIRNGTVTENSTVTTGDGATVINYGNSAETDIQQALPTTGDVLTLDQFADDMATAIAKDVIWAEIRKRIPSAITREIIRLLSSSDAKAEFRGIAAEWISPLQSEALDSAVRIQMIEASSNGHRAIAGVSDEN